MLSEVLHTHTHNTCIDSRGRTGIFGGSTPLTSWDAPLEYPGSRHKKLPVFGAWRSQGPSDLHVCHEICPLSEPEIYSNKIIKHHSHIIK